LDEKAAIAKKALVVTVKGHATIEPGALKN
jgi:hypothetical protein